MKYTCHVFDCGCTMCDNVRMLNVAFLRKSKKLTQSQLAELVGVSQAHISRLENGDDSASLKLINDIAQALGVRPADLLSDRSEKEVLLVKAFREASPEVQKLLLSMASASAGDARP